MERRKLFKNLTEYYADQSLCACYWADCSSSTYHFRELKRRVITKGLLIEILSGHGYNNFDIVRTIRKGSAV